MARLACHCGATLSNCASPNDGEGWLLRDIDLERNEQLDAGQILTISRNVWECHRCGRLAVQRNEQEGSREILWYLPERGPAKLMAFQPVIDPNHD